MKKFFIRAKYLVSYSQGINFAEFIVFAESPEEANKKCVSTYGWNCIIFEILTTLDFERCKEGCILADVAKFCKDNEDDDEEDEYI